MEEHMSNAKFEHIKEIISTIDMKSLDDSLIKDNKLYFDYDNKSYRICMPSHREVNLTQKFKDKTYLKLIQEDVCFTKLQLKKILKEKQNIDLDKLEEQRLEVQKKLQDEYLDLAMVDPDNEAKVLEYKLKINEIELEHNKLFIEITEYYSPAIENQLEKIYVEYMTFLCSEVQDNENWKKVWNSFEEFDTSENNILIQCVKHMTYLLLRTNR